MSAFLLYWLGYPPQGQYCQLCQLIRMYSLFVIDLYGSGSKKHYCSHNWEQQAHLVPNNYTQLLSMICQRTLTSQSKFYVNTHSMLAYLPMVPLRTNTMWLKPTIVIKSVDLKVLRQRWKNDAFGMVKTLRDDLQRMSSIVAVIDLDHREIV